jgi:outer membrane murein-binding lipoprotein Lpp
MRFKKLITPLLITVIICATLALGYQQNTLRLPNPFSGAGQTQKKDYQSAEVKELYSRITNLERKVSLLEMRIKDLQNFAGIPCAPLKERLCVPEPDFQKPRVIPYQQDPLRRGLTNPFSGAGQTQKKDYQSAEVKDLYSRITNLESKVSSLEKRIEDLQKTRVLERAFGVEHHGGQPLIWR